MVAGDVDMACSPTPPVINQISNAGVPLVAVYGMPNPDWVIGTTEDGKTCKDLVGQDVGVDFDRRRALGGAALDARRLPPAVKLDQIKQVALGSSSGPAMIAGRLHYAVLHLDDLAEIEAQGKKLHILLAMKNTNPTSHYLMLVVRKDNLAEEPRRHRAHGRRPDRGRALHAGPEERRRGGRRRRGHRPHKAVNKAALKEFLAIDFWATKDDGLPRNKLEATAKLMKKIGAIKPDKEPVTYEQLVDASVWKDANAMVK